MGFLELSLHSQHCHNGICSRKIPSSLRESVVLNVGLGIPFSFPIIVSSEIGKPNYLHVNTCNNVQIMHTNAYIDETRHFV